MSLGGYPLGAGNDPRAPYNQKENPEVEIEVCVSITLHKTFKLKVSDYTIVDEGKDEDGDYFCERDFSSCNLYEAAQEQLDLSNPSEENGWTEDEFEVIKE